MPENPYQQVPYLTVPMAQTHPDRLASVATLFGMEPAPVTACRVLEVGCGSGGNLIPMAHFLPGSHFVGVDLAEGPVAEGRGWAGELGLANLELIAMDLCEIGPAMGEFDYIIAHGVYSWVSDGVREGLLAMCRERLAPQGVACISYNALPGRHVRMMLREMMLYHTRDCTEPGQRVQRARDLLRMVGEARLSSLAWQPMIDEEIERMMAGNPGWFFHDDLAAVNDSFYVRDFVARAARHSLQYLGDAEAHLMFDVKNALTWLGDDVIEREQYMDFLCFRRFRQTLLCRAEAPLKRPAGPEQMDRFLFSSPARQSEAQIEGLNSVCITEAPPAVTRVAAAMGEVFPLPVAFDRLLEHAADRETLCGILFTLISSGFAEFHVNDLASGKSVGARPRGSRRARWESVRTGVVTYSNHSVLKLDPTVRALIELLDGMRDLDGIAHGLAQVEGAPAFEEIRERLPQILAHMARTGLLEE
jgi:SAM-dependent methyltransferase